MKTKGGREKLAIFGRGEEGREGGRLTGRKGGGEGGHHVLDLTFMCFYVLDLTFMRNVSYFHMILTCDLYSI